jgi:hypothetical protein
MTDENIIVKQEFAQVRNMITLCRSRALQTVNSENLLTAWEIGTFVSARLDAEYRRQLIPKEVLQRSLEEFMGFLNKKK